MSAAEQAADQISAYLTMGMHHSTPEGRIAMAHIIEAAISPPEAHQDCWHHERADYQSSLHRPYGR